MSLFGQKPANTSLFGASTATPAFSFGTPVNNQQTLQPSSTPFGAPSTNQQAQQQPGSSVFGAPAQNQNSTSIFGQNTTQPANLNQTNQPQSQPNNVFGSFQKLGGFSSFGQTTAQQQPQQAQQQGSAHRPLDQTLRFGQSTQNPNIPQNDAAPIWEEGRGMGVYRSIPAQIMMIKDKWDPASLQSPLRSYLYQHVSDEGAALRYRPGPGEDESKWEDAVQKRPSPTWVPLIVRGFFELGKKAQIQMEAIQRCNMMLQEINASLDAQLDTHRQKVATRLAECKRRHQVASQRTLALAVKVQILRNRGYIMDNAEEELKTKLELLEKQVFDPALHAREQEIWARMLGIRERAKRLKAEMDRITPTTENDEPLLDEGTIKAAKQTLEAYDLQLRHLQKEVSLIQQEFDDWEQLSQSGGSESPYRR